MLYIDDSLMHFTFELMFSNRFMYMFMQATWLRILILGSWFLQGHAWYTRLRRRWFGGCVLLKFWGESYVKPLSLRLMYKLYLIMDCVVVWARWTMDIGLDSSVVEHLTSNAGVLGLIPGPAIYFHLYFFVFVHSSHPYYNWNILFYTDYCGEFWRSTAYTSCRGGVRKACYQRKQVGHNICVQNKNISCCQKLLFCPFF